MDYDVRNAQAQRAVAKGAGIEWKVDDQRRDGGDCCSMKAVKGGAPYGYRVRSKKKGGGKKAQMTDARGAANSAAPTPPMTRPPDMMRTSPSFWTLVSRSFRTTAATRATGNGTMPWVRTLA